MKRMMSLLLALCMVLTLCACGGGSKTYETAEEYAEAILEKKQDADKQNKGYRFMTDYEEEFKADTANHHFFSEEEQDNLMWEKLYLNSEGKHDKNCLSLYDIYTLYAIANGGDYWFDRLNIHGVPFGYYGDYSSYYSGIFSRNTIADGIRNEFDNPGSVKIVDSMFLYPRLLDDENAVAFDSPLECLLLVNVKASGGHGTHGYLLKVRGSSIEILTKCNFNELTGADSMLKRSDYFIGFSEKGNRITD